MALCEFAFPADAGNRVILQIGAAYEESFVVEAEGRVGFELQAADEVVAIRDEHGAAAGFGAGINGFLKSGGVFGFALAGGAEVFDVEKRMGGGGDFVRIGTGFRCASECTRSGKISDENGDETRNWAADKRHGWSGVNALRMERGMKAGGGEK